MSYDPIERWEWEGGAITVAVPIAETENGGEAPDDRVGRVKRVGLAAANPAYPAPPPPGDDGTLTTS